MQPLASSSELLLADPFFREKHMYHEWESNLRPPGYLSGVLTTAPSRQPTLDTLSIQPSQQKQVILRTGFDSNVFFSGVLQFQLLRSLTLC